MNWSRFLSIHITTVSCLGTIYISVGENTKLKKKKATERREENTIKYIKLNIVCILSLTYQYC